MQNIDKYFNRINNIVLSVIVFLTPILFLPITRDFVVLSKYYFFLFAVIALLILSLIKLFITKKIYWNKNPFIQSFFLIILAYALSIIIMSPNKIQALLQPNYGMLMIAGMISFYLYLTNSISLEKKNNLTFLFTLSGFVTSLFALIIVINPFKNADVPYIFSFLKNTYFNSVGNQVELIGFLVFTLILAGQYLFKAKHNKSKESQNAEMNIMYGIFSLFIALGIGSQIFIIAKTILSEGGQIILPPLNESWYTAIEVLKNPITALFGVGVDNFTGVFPRAKELSYNASNLWQVSTFQTSRSAVLHILTELGLVGFAGFLLLCSKAVKHFDHVKTEHKAVFIFTIVLLVLFPPSFITWFMFFTSLALISSDLRQKEQAEVYEIDFAQIVPIFIGFVVIYILVVGSFAYVIGRSFASEIYFKKSIDAIAKNDLVSLYQNQQQAVILNGFNEDFRISFSQTNLLLANRIASKKKEDITEQDRTDISKAIQQAILEAKAAVALNQQDVTNWQNLAEIYRNILNVAQGAEVWTVSAYQKTIELDPKNPIYSLQLGGIYYLYGNYDEAQSLFEQSVLLKPDWANSHYNLAWTYYQKKQYQAAADQMQVVLTLTDPKKAEADYKKAQKDLEEFKKLIPAKTEQPAAEGQTEKAKDLNLPSPPPATVEPKLELPRNASPESNVNR